MPAGQETHRPDLVEQRDGRQVERHLQGMPSRDAALEVLVEIHRPVSTVMRRPVLDHGVGRRDAVLERECVDEGLQSGPRRPVRPGHVEGAGARDRTWVRRADIGQHLAGGVVDHDQGARHGGAEALGMPPHQGFDAGLQPSVEGEAHRGCAAVGRARFPGRVEGQRRKVAAAVRHGLAPRGFGLGGLGEPERHGVVDHAVARGAGLRGEAVGTAALGCLGQGDQQCCLGEAQAARLVPEPGEARGPDALQIAAVRCEAQLEFEDLDLAEASLQRQRADRLVELRAERPVGPGRHEAGDLHGQGRGARHDAAARDPWAAARGSTPSCA